MQLREYFAVLWARRATVVLTIVLFVAAAIAANSLRTPDYTAEARVLVGSPDAARTVLGIASDPSLAQPDRALRTQAELATSLTLAEAARKAGKLQQTPTRLLEMVEVSPVESADLLSIRATSTSPKLASRVANAFASAYVTRAAAEQRASIAAASQELEGQRKAAMNELRRNGMAADGGVNGRGQVAVATLSRIDEQIERLKTSSALELAGTRVVERAATPSEPDGITGLVPSALVGLALGLLAGVGIAFVADHFDTRLRTPGDLAKVGVDLIGTLPGDRTDRGPAALTMLREPASRAADAYRLLRVGLAPESGTPLRILVTSSDASKASVSVGANLAIAFVQAGARVVLLDADFRQAPLRRLFDLASTSGLAEVLGHSRGLAEVAQYPVHQRLMTVPSGPLPGNPGELLSSSRMEQVLAEAASSADVLVIVSPPISVTADALALASRVDRVLLAVDAGAEREAGVVRDLAAFARVPKAAPVSAVLWGLRADNVTLAVRPKGAPARQADASPGDGSRSESLRPGEALAR